MFRVVLCFFNYAERKHIRSHFNCHCTANERRNKNAKSESLREKTRQLKKECLHNVNGKSQAHEKRGIAITNKVLVIVIIYLLRVR